MAAVNTRRAIAALASLRSIGLAEKLETNQ
jgi:hypothetical protein